MLAPARAIGFAARTTSLLLLGGAGVVFGWSFRETTNAAGATLELYDGTSTGGNLLTSITLIANESTRDLIGGEGLSVVNGIYLSVIAGTVTGSVWVVTEAGEVEPNTLTGERESWDRVHL